MHIHRKWIKSYTLPAGDVRVGTNISTFHVHQINHRNHSSSWNFSGSEDTKKVENNQFFVPLTGNTLLETINIVELMKFSNTYLRDQIYVFPSQFQVNDYFEIRIWLPLQYHLYIVYRHIIDIFDSKIQIINFTRIHFVCDKCYVPIFNQ